MLKNNILYRSLLALLCIIFLVIGWTRLYNLDILHRTLYGFIIIPLCIGGYIYENNKYVFAVTKIMKLITIKTVKYTLDLLTFIFLLVHFSIKIFNIYYQYELKNITEYIKHLYNLPQFALSAFFVLLLIVTCCFWLCDILNIINKVLSEVKENPSTVSFESYSWILRLFCVMCYMISVAGLVYILYDLFLDGLMGTFGL